MAKCMRRIHEIATLQFWALAGDFPEKLENVLLNSLDVGLDRFERPRRLIFVEVTVEIDLVTDLADLVVPVVAHRFVNPGVAGKSGVAQERVGSRLNSELRKSSRAGSIRPPRRAG